MDKEEIEAIVRNVIQNLGQTEQKTAEETPNHSGAGVDAAKDYPLGTTRPDLINTPTGKELSDITLKKVLSGEIAAADVRITPETLEYQAEIARQKDRGQFAKNLERAAELTQVPDERILEIYNALRPHRSTKDELLAIADELENEYSAVVNAKLIREAADVYEQRERLKGDAR